MIDVIESVTTSTVPLERRASAGCSYPLSAERELELAVRIKAGDPAAREELVLANLPLVRNIASAFRGRNRVIDLNDLIQEGNLGLLRAASDFDPEAHGTRFVNYAACWIRYRIRRVVAEQSTTIRYPYYLVLLRRRFEKARQEMMAASEATSGSIEPTEPDFEEVFNHMGVEGSRLKTLRNMRDELRSRSMASISDPSHDAALARMVPPQEPLEIAESMEHLHAALRKLTLIQSWVLRRRYRVEDVTVGNRVVGRGKPGRKRGVDAPILKADGYRTFRELSAEIGMPIHQLRAIERSALSKLQEILGRGTASEATRTEPVGHQTLPSRRSA